MLGTIIDEMPQSRGRMHQPKPMAIQHSSYSLR